MKRLIVLALVVVACNAKEARQDAERLTGGNSERGKSAIKRYGCAACHTIPGVRGATGTVGPPLDKIYNRTYLAGRLANNAGNLIRWIQHPQKVDPNTAMPEMAVTAGDARDIAAYLYTLR